MVGLLGPSVVRPMSRSRVLRPARCCDAHRLALHLDPVQVLAESVEQRVGHGGATEYLVLVRDRELTGDNGRAQSGSILNHLKGVSGLLDVE